VTVVRSGNGGGGEEEEEVGDDGDGGRTPWADEIEAQDRAAEAAKSSRRGKKAKCCIC